MENREALYIAARRYYTATSFHLFALSLNSNVHVDACTHDVCKSRVFVRACDAFAYTVF